MPVEESYVLDFKRPLMERLLRGGISLPHDPDSGSLILIRGKPGTGKSTLALQVLDQLATSAKRLYCSAEQTQSDLRYKLASMWVAQAIEESRRPRTKASCFRYRADTLLTMLRKRCGGLPDFGPIEKKCIKQATLPLFQEPGKGDVKKNRRMATALSAWLVNHWNDPEGIEFHSSLGLQGQTEGQPIRLGQQRVIGVSRILTQLLHRNAQAPTRRSHRPVVVVDGLSLLSSSERGALELQWPAPQKLIHLL